MVYHTHLCHHSSIDSILYLWLHVHDIVKQNPQYKHTHPGSDTPRLTFTTTTLLNTNGGIHGSNKQLCFLNNNMRGIIYLHISNPIKYSLTTEGWFRKEGITRVQFSNTFGPWEKVAMESSSLSLMSVQPVKLLTRFHSFTGYSTPVLWNAVC